MVVRAVGVVFLAVVLAVIVYAETAAAEDIYARQVQFKPLIDWDGPVLLEMPEGLVSGSSGLYVSTEPDCSVALPTWWEVVGDTAFIVFDPGVQLDAGTLYTYYVCYGTIIVEKDTSLAVCRLPGGLDQCLARSSGNLSLTETRIYLSYNTTIENTTYVFNETVPSTSITVALSDTGIYLVNASVVFRADVNQSYTVTVLSNGEPVADADAVYVETVVQRDDTGTYDTGTRYYDTGVYTIYNAGTTITATDGYVYINVYDSDRDTYYVYVYLDGVEVARWYQRTAINFSLAGRTFQTIAVRVYDTERNDYVRAWGDYRVLVAGYVHQANLTVEASLAPPVALRIAGSSNFTAAGNATIYYYNSTLASGELWFNTSQPLIVVLGLTHASTPNATITTGGEGGRVILDTAAGHVYTRVLGQLEAIGYTPPLDAAASPDAAAADNAGGELAGVFADEYPGAITGAGVTAVTTVDAPGNYTVLEFTGLLVFDALTNYTDYLVGGAFTPGQPGTGTGTGGVINGSVVVNVATEMDPDVKMLIITFSIAAPFVLALFTFYRAIRTNNNIYIAVTIGLIGLSSIAAYAAGYYDAARAILFMTLLAAYPIIERAVDTIIATLRRR